MKTVTELAELVSGQVEGDGSVAVRAVQSLEDAREGDISFAVNLKLADKVRESRASAFILPQIWPDELKVPSIRVKDPYLAYALVAQALCYRPFEPQGISEKAIIGKGCNISECVTIMPGAVIGDGCTIGKEVTIHPGTVLGNNVKIGNGSTLFASVVVYDQCIIGNNVRLHAGAVIGADGFGYARNGDTHEKIPQTGIVVIEDDVEIGANSTIDRAALGETRIGKGTKIDNMVMIGHNVQVGQSSIIVSQVGIAGSTRIGNGVVLAGQVGVTGHIEIGDGSMVGAKSGVAHSLPPGSQVSGQPAIPHTTWLKAVNIFKRLPDMARDFREIKKIIRKLQDTEENIADNRDKNNEA